jgi:hypothetical protein
MIDRSHDLPITKQAKALGISRGSVYSLPRPVPAADHAIMRRIDELHLEYPFAGSRMLRDLLALEGIKTGRLHGVTLMKRMGDRGDLSQAEYIEAGAGAQDLSVSAWTAKAHGVTTSLSSGFGDRSNGKRCISELTTRCPRLPLRSAPISNFTIADGHIRASTGGRPIRLTSAARSMPRRRKWQIGIVMLGVRRRHREGCGHAALRAAKLGQRESVAHTQPRAA